MTAPTKLEEALDELERATIATVKMTGTHAQADAARAAVLAVVRELAGAAQRVVDAWPEEGRSNRFAYSEHGMLCAASRGIGACDCGMTEGEASVSALRAALALVPRGDDHA